MTSYANSETVLEARSNHICEVRTRPATCRKQIITERSGRFVLVVQAEHRGAIPGIVHGSSGSGASLFLEPLSTVKINNDIVVLEENEANEIRRILLKLSDAIRKRPLDLQYTIKAATEIDVIQARAAFSLLVDGVPLALSADTRIELPQARHPLLIPAVRQRLGNTLVEDEPVPVDLSITPSTTALVITGPNTGGKTVALKTTGLLVLMGSGRVACTSSSWRLGYGLPHGVC